MISRRQFASSIFGVSLSSLFLGRRAQGQLGPLPLGPPPARKILAIGDVHRKIYQHDSVSHAMAMVWYLGRKTGLFDTYIHTDIQLLTKHPIDFAESHALKDSKGNDVNYKTLNDFDAVFFYGIGELELTDQNKADLLSFVRDDGKAWIGAHTAIDAWYTWPAYGEMIGGYFVNHPWGIFNAPIIVEDPNFPAMTPFPRAFHYTDEIYQVKDFSRKRVRVLASLDDSKLDMKVPGIVRTDGDFPVAWAREYGKGRVFYSCFGHQDESWYDPRMQAMWLDAIKWGLGLIPGHATPRPKPNRKA
ncbi:MAG TPA: ThuA domain-containing protein [Terriglobales bacterium]|jgi:hypothetical protein